MSRSTILRTAFGAAMVAAMAAATPAYAIDPGCYSADTVRKATWLAEGPEKQFTIIAGERAAATRNMNFFTSSADGSIGYNIEGNGKTDDGESDKLCIRAKYQNVRVTTEAVRPTWVQAPPGSGNDHYLSAQAQRDGVRVIFGASTVVHRNGQDYVGPQLLVTKTNVAVAGTTTAGVTGAVITSDRSGEGDALFAMMNLRTNANFDAMVRAQGGRLQTASLLLGMK